MTSIYELSVNKKRQVLFRFFSGKEGYLVNMSRLVVNKTE